MDNKLDPKLEALTKEATERFVRAIEAQHNDLKETHIKKEYTFTVEEKRRLNQMQLMAVFLQQAIDDIVNINVLPRIGVSPNPTIKALYDISLGKIVVWTPTESLQAQQPA